MSGKDEVLLIFDGFPVLYLQSPNCETSFLCDLISFRYRLSESIFDFHGKRDKYSVIITGKMFTKRGGKSPTKPISEKKVQKRFFMHESQIWHTHSLHLMVQLPVLTLEPYRNALSHIAYLFLWRINILRMALWSFHGEFDGMLYNTAAYKGIHKH